MLNILFPSLGLLRHPEKGVWGCGTTRLKHLGIVIDTVSFRYFITPQKLGQLRSMATRLLQTVPKSRRWVRESLVRTFAGTAISQLVPIPLARFFTRGIYDDLKKSQPRRGRYPEQNVRLSNAGIRDLKAWRDMLQGDGRLIYGGAEAWNLHTDAADVGYGGTLGTDLRPGTPGEIEVQAVWSPFLRLKSITHRELVAVRLSLESDLVQARLQEYHGTIRLQVDNMAVFYIVNNMVSANPALMSELRSLHTVLTAMKVTLKASWLPSAMNKHADRLSRTWKPADLAVTASLLKSLAESLQLQTVRRYWPMKDAPAARAKVLRAQFNDFWGDGLSRLWNPPDPYCSDASENRQGARPRSHSRPALDGRTLVQAIAENLPLFQNHIPGLRHPLRLRIRQPSMGARVGRGRPQAARAVELAIAARLPQTAGGRASLRLAASVLAPSTGSTKSSQWNKFSRFCDIEGHVALPTSVGTLLAYIGFLFEEDRVHSSSVDHYISAIRTRHLREGHPDPCTGQHQRDLIRAFRREDDARGELHDVRAAIPASAIARIRVYGMAQPERSRRERDAALIEFQYLLSWRESSGRTVQVQDVDVCLQIANPRATSTFIRLTVRPRSLKGRSVRGAPASQVTCMRTDGLDPLGLQLRYSRYRSSALPSDLYWSYDGDTPGPQVVTQALQDILGFLSIVPPPFCFYSSHSLRSGSASALILLGVPLPVIMQRGPWTSLRLVLNVYFDGRLHLTPEMEQYFWSLQPSAPLPSPQ